MFRSTVILLALAFMLFAGNAFAWDKVVHAYIDTAGMDDDSDYALITWSSYALYELIVDVNDTENQAGYAYANIHTSYEGEIVQYANLSTYKGYDKKMTQFRVKMQID